MSAEPKIVREFRDLLRGKDDDELLALAYRSPAVHFALFMEVKDKSGRYIRPSPNVLQLRISEAIEVLRDRCPGLRIRIIAVKPRRAGCSTFSLHCGYHEAMRRPIEGITIADVKDNSEMLMARLVDYTGHDSFPWENRLVQDARKSVAWSNGSTWTVDTAENPDAGVGGTRQFGHLSEVAKYPQTQVKNDVKTITAAMPSFDGVDTTVIAESTPEGAVGWMYDTFDKKAMWLEDFIKRWEAGFRPEEQWIRVFAAWWEFDDYRRQTSCTAAEIQHIEDTMDDEEREERDKYNLSYEQLAWRRDCIENQCAGQVSIFRYYYPSDPVSCWLSSGSPRFDMQRLVEWENRSRGITPEAGYLVRQDRDQVMFHAQRDGTGDILIYERPKPGLCYAVVVDPAESKSQTIGKDTDAHSICVYRKGYHDTNLNRWIKPRLVARVRPPYQAEEDEAAQHAIRLSHYYGRAIIAPESNKGFHLLRILQTAGMSIYKRKPISHRTGKVEEQYGFKTDANNREAIISGLASAIARDDIDIHDEHMIAELKKFIRNVKGRSEAARGEHDDDVMNLAIAWEVLPAATLYTTETARFEDPPDEQTWKAAANRW